MSYFFSFESPYWIVTYSGKVPKYCCRENTPFIIFILQYWTRASQAAQWWRIGQPVQVTQDTRVQPLGWEDALETGKATHSSILSWRIPVDRGAWRATVHGVTKSRTRPSERALFLGTWRIQMKLKTCGVFKLNHVFSWLSVSLAPHLPSPAITTDVSVMQESACNAGDLGSIPGLGRSPGEGKGSLLQRSGLEKSIDSVVGGVANSWTWLSDFHSLRLSLLMLTSIQLR